MTTEPEKAKTATKLITETTQWLECN